MHCEAKERFSWPVRSGTCAVTGIVYGQLLNGRAKPHISNICRMHMKNLAVISQEKGIRSMKRIKSIVVKRREQFDFYFVSEPCFVMKGWDVGGVLGDQYF